MAVFFVGGCARAGTTLMQAVLCADRDSTPVMAESTNLSALFKAYGQGLDQFEKSVGDFFPDRAGLKTFYTDTINRYLDAVKQRTGAEHLVFKDPNLTPNLHEVHDLLPDARFVVILRHPFDVIASMIRVSKRLLAGGEAWSPFQHTDLGAMCGQYLGCYDSLLDAQNRIEAFRDALVLVRYEDLVVDPGPVLRNLSEATGLDCADFDIGAPWRMFSRRVFEGTKRQETFATKLAGQGISADSVGRYGDVLAADDCVLIKERCRDAIRAFGYEDMPAFHVPAADAKERKRLKDEPST